MCGKHKSIEQCVLLLILLQPENQTMFYIMYFSRRIVNIYHVFGCTFRAAQYLLNIKITKLLRRECYLKYLEIQVVQIILPFVADGL